MEVLEDTDVGGGGGGGGDSLAIVGVVRDRLTFGSTLAAVEEALLPIASEDLDCFSGILREGGGVGGTA